MMRRVRLSRWGRSPYETEADILLEAESLAEWVSIQPEGADAEIVVIHSKIPFGPEEHGRAPSLQLVVTTTSGTDHIDLEHFHTRGIAVCRLPEARRDAVVEMTIAMLIWGMRGVGTMQEAARQGLWVRDRLPELSSIGLRGSRIGVVGLGVIGRQLCHVLRPFGVEIWGTDPNGVPEGVQEVPLAEMMGHCDAVTLHCALEQSTRLLLSGAVLDGAHPDLVVVNTARGSIVDVDHAINMVRSNRLGALALDVFPQEPWPNLSISKELDRVMLLPHAAGYHRGLAEMVRGGLCRVVSAFVNGVRLPHQV